MINYVFYVLIVICIIDCFFQILSFLKGIKLAKKLELKKEEYNKLKEEFDEKTTNLRETYKKDVKKYDNLIEKYEDIIFKLKYQNTILTTVITIEAYLKLIHSLNQEEKSYTYNRLYFWGVPKEFLDNEEKLIYFSQKCLLNEVEIENGIKPFTYKFKLK